METHNDQISAYIKEVNDIKQRMDKLNAEIPNATTSRHLELQEILQKYQARLLEIKVDLEKLLVVKSAKDKESKERKSEEEKRRLMVFLEEVYNNYLGYNPEGKIANGTIIDTKIKDLRYDSLKRLRIDGGNFFGKIEFISQDGESEDFETAKPVLVNINIPVIREEFERWRKQHGDNTSSIYQLMDYVREVYSEDYYLPGLDYLSFLMDKIKNDPNHKIFSQVISRKYCFPGTIIYHYDGVAFLPAIYENKPSGVSLINGLSNPPIVVLIPKKK